MSVMPGLMAACKEVARQVLSGPASSSDLVETLALQFYRIAEDHQDFVRRQREDDDVIEHAVRYIAAVHATPSCGTDAAWFQCKLGAILEIAVPNAGLCEESAKLLPCLQVGIAQALADVPVSRNSVRIEDDDAKELKALERAGVEWGCVSDMLDLVERLYHGDPLTESDLRFYRLYALAAPLTRQARIDAGLAQ